MKDPAFPFYAQDFLVGTMHMDFEDIGRYIKLMAYQWTNNKIPKKRLGLLVGLSWVDFPADLKEKFKDNSEFIWNERLEIEREKRLEFKEKQRINGRKGGRPKNPNLKSGLTQKKPLESESDNENEEEYKEEINVEFDLFWDLYDKKVGSKPKLIKKWAALSDKERELIIEYIPKYKQAQPDKKYRKNPETFLNNKSWNDEIIEASSQTARKTTIPDNSDAKSKFFARVGGSGR